MQPSPVCANRIDLLALDLHEQPVIIELKRGSDRLHLFQAISYAGMVSIVKNDGDQTWREILVPQSEEIRGIDAGRAARVIEFLQGADSEDEQDSREPRIILVAEAFDYEVLVGAKWLYEKFDVDITCVLVTMAHDDTNDAEYLAFTQVFPTAEIEEIAKNRRRRKLARPGSLGTTTPKPAIPAKDLLDIADSRQVRSLVDVLRELQDIWDEKPSGGENCFVYSITTPAGWGLCARSSSTLES